MLSCEDCECSCLLQGPCPSAWDNWAISRCWTSRATSSLGGVRLPCTTSASCTALHKLCAWISNDFNLLSCGIVGVSIQTPTRVTNTGCCTVIVSDSLLGVLLLCVTTFPGALGCARRCWRDSWHASKAPRGHFWEACGQLQMGSLICIFELPLAPRSFAEL